MVLALLVLLNAAALVLILVWAILKDVWMWWRGRPPELVTRHPGFFRILEPLFVVLVGVFVLAARVLGDIGWLVIFVGIAWLLFEIEQQRNVRKAIRFQIRMAKEKGD